MPTNCFIFGSDYKGWSPSAKCPAFFFPTGAADEGHEGAQGGNFKIRHVTKGFLLTALKMHFQFQGPQARVFFSSF